MSENCTVPPRGWYCTREPGHEGPCAAIPHRIASIGDDTVLREALLFKAIAHVHANGKGVALPSAVDLMDPVSQRDLDRLHKYVGDICEALAASPSTDASNADDVVEAAQRLRGDAERFPGPADNQAKVDLRVAPRRRCPRIRAEP